MEGRLCRSVQGVKLGMKSALDVLELGMCREIENLRKDVEEKLEATTSVECLECEKAKKLQGEISLVTVSGLEPERSRKAVWEEMEALINEKIHRKLLECRDESIEGFDRIGAEAVEIINREQVLLKAENASSKNQLRQLKKESMRTRAGLKDLKKDMELDMEEFRLAVGRMNRVGEGMKKNIIRIHNAGKDLICEQKTLKKSMERIEDEIKMKNISGAVRDGYDMELDGKDLMIISEKDEKMSKLFLGALKEIKLLLTLLSESMHKHEDISKETECMESCARSKLLQAKAALAEILDVHRTNIDLSKDVAEARSRCTDELEGYIAAVKKKSLVHEASMVQSHAERIEEEKKKMMAHDLGKARTALDGIKKEKMKLMSMAEADGVENEEELEQRTETTTHRVESIHQERSNSDDKLEDMDLHGLSKSISQETPSSDHKLENMVSRSL